MADASINFDALSYNSMRDDLVISEYGRSIHQMVDHCLSIADRDERSKCAAAIVSVMGSVVKQEGEKDEAAQKLWNQLHVMARYELDVDSPFPKPEPAEKDSAPEDMDYPNAQSRVGHYGKTTLDLIEAAKGHGGRRREAGARGEVGQLDEASFPDMEPQHGGRFCDCGGTQGEVWRGVGVARWR